MVIIWSEIYSLKSIHYLYIKICAQPKLLIDEASMEIGSVAKLGVNLVRKVGDFGLGYGVGMERGQRPLMNSFQK